MDEFIKKPEPPGQVIAADWLVAAEGGFLQAVPQGGVRVAGDGLILAVGPFDQILSPGDRLTFLPSAVLTAGLINAHAHLDLSYWRGGRAALAGKPLHDWVVPVVAERLLRPPDEVGLAAAAGAGESLACGVTTVVDVTPASLAWAEVLAAVGKVPIRRLALVEVVGFGGRAEAFWADALIALRTSPSPSNEGGWGEGEARGADGGRLLGVGLSPHAPYSANGELYRRCLAEAVRSGRVLMTHLAETPEEVEFCLRGTGPWRQRLEQLAGPQQGLGIPGCSPVRYAHRLGLLEHWPTLLAHVNYLEPGDLELLAGGRAAVVYCPRSADFFGHRDHPCQGLLAAGVNVAIGTDSLASSPDLSVLAELRFLGERHPQTPATELFAMATARAAEAIGLGGRLGVLAPGAWADLSAWPLPGPIEPRQTAESLLSRLVASGPRPRAVFVGGRQVMP